MNTFQLRSFSCRTKQLDINIFIAYELDNWPKVLLTNITLKNYLFGETTIAKNNDKLGKYITATE